MNDLFIYPPLPNYNLIVASEQTHRVLDKGGQSQFHPSDFVVVRAQTIIPSDLPINIRSYGELVHSGDLSD